MEHPALIDVVVKRRQTEAESIVSLELARADGVDLLPFSAGSHVDVHLASGLIRQYSLCNAETERHRYLVAVLRDPASRGGSDAVHALAEGQSVRISAPRNHFPLRFPARHSLLLAGGIGVTPLLCMAERLWAAEASFELHYAARSPGRAAFVDRLRDAPYGKHVHLHFDDGDPAQKLRLDDVLATVPEETDLYVCGPVGFMDWVLGTAAAHGWPEERLHREYFSAKTVDTSSDGRFDVKVASSGQVIAVAPDQTVVAALAACGIALEVSCEQGVCGTCLTRILQGTPEHRDMFMTDAEHAANDRFTPCCSRAKSRLLVLDL